MGLMLMVTIMATTGAVMLLNSPITKIYFMKTYKNLYEEIISEENLYLAFQKAKKGKIKKVLMKIGIPFVPSFFIGFIITLIYGNLVFLLLL